MGQEIDLLANYPKAKRNLDERAAEKTEEDRRVARRFDKDFFDGERRHGYGGFGYNARFWSPVMPTFQQHFNLGSNSSVLDVGCAKAFMLYDMVQAIPGIHVHGIDISDYAIQNAKEEMKSRISTADARRLPFADDSFDVVISINTVHNLTKYEVAIALQEIERVSKGNSFVTVDAYRSDDEKERMFKWNLTAKTIMSVSEWVSFFDEVGYTGDYFWFIP